MENFNQNYGQPYQGYNQPQQQVSMNKGFSNGTQPISGWSWGAFMFNIMWGLGNKCYLPLLCLIPGFNIIWIFVCGAKGHEWAMNSGTFQTVEEYNAAQKTWDRAGKIAFFVYIAFLVLWFLFFGAIMSLIGITINSGY